MTAYYTALSLVLRFADAEPPLVSAPGSISLKYAPMPPQSLQLYRNGILQTQGSDYTMYGGNISLMIPAASDDKFICWYRY